MATYIEMPKLSDTMTEGTLVKWLKQEGDRIEIGDILAEVETDKATMEMEAFDEGILGRIYAAEGSKVAIGAKLAVLVDEGEAPPDQPAAAAGESAPAEPTEAPAEAGGSAEAVESPATKAATDAHEPGGRVKASPLAKKIARDKGIHIGSLKGSGPGGRVVKADVLKAAEGGAASTGAPAKTGGAPAPARPAAITATAGEGDRKIPLTGMRTIIAERLLASKTQIPHFYLHIEVDAAPLMALRQQVNAAAEANPEANKYTVNDFVLKAVVAAAVDVPGINASFAGDHIIQFAGVHLAIAVAVDDGLVTPVVRDAQTKSLLEMSLAVKDLANRARSRKLKLEEMQGGTVTVSNLGAYGIESFDAIINPPQAAILSIGAIVRKPVVDSRGELAVGTRVDVGLSCDHRVVDGAVGATYLQAVKKYLEQPALMLV